MEHVTDLLPGYALGCLDEDEMVKVARHLPYCAACREELSSYLMVVDELPLLAPLQTPSQALRGEILRRIEQPAPRFKETPARKRMPGGIAGFFGSLFAHPVPLALAAMALLLVVVLSVSNWMLWRQVNDLRAQAPATSGEMRLVQLAGTENAPNALGYLMVFSGENYGTLVIEDAPPLYEGYQYQLWLIRDGHRYSGGVLSVDNQGYGVLEITSNIPLNSYTSFGVTIEPYGGSPGPTGKRVLAGDL